VPLFRLARGADITKRFAKKSALKAARNLTRVIPAGPTGQKRVARLNFGRGPFPLTFLLTFLLTFPFPFRIAVAGDDAAALGDQAALAGQIDATFVQSA
jgi:hypothetical protein